MHTQRGPNKELPLYLGKVIDIKSCGGLLIPIKPQKEKTVSPPCYRCQRYDIYQRAASSRRDSFVVEDITEQQSANVNIRRLHLLLLQKWPTMGSSPTRQHQEPTQRQLSSAARRSSAKEGRNQQIVRTKRAAPSKAAPTTGKRSRRHIHRGQRAAGTDQVEWKTNYL